MVIVVKEKVEEKKEQEKPKVVEVIAAPVESKPEGGLEATSLRNETVKKVSGEEVDAAFAYENWLKKQALGGVIASDNDTEEDEEEEEEQEPIPPAKPRDPTMDKSGIVVISFSHEMAIPSFINADTGIAPPEERRLFGAIRKYLPSVLGGITKNTPPEPYSHDADEHDQRSL